MPAIPTDYRPGYAQALAVAPHIAANYVRHTRIGDPLADSAAAAIADYTDEIRSISRETGPIYTDIIRVPLSR